MFRILAFLAVISAAAAAFLHAKNTTRLGNLWNLERVSECVLGWSAIHYNDYGCWCGVGGAGTPVDGIDDCCMHHDKCYDAAVDTKLCFDVPEEYAIPYDWKCESKHATCTDAPTPPSCRASICACDMAVVQCWSKYPKPETKAKCNHVPSFFAKLDFLKKYKTKIEGFFH